ncbi:MAG: helicase-related protein [Candidatus Bathyarchaeota archaeon]|jgi:superfamily II DNA/RNA helicase|nr:helicase-related protein [Candidatus Bathyarchaeota archaeon]
MSKDYDYELWLCNVQGLSKFESLLPAQLKLLREIYEALTETNEKVVSFTAPPASGKTHVIVLTAVYLSLKGGKTCIVTPNGELSVDFKEELKQIKIENPSIAVLSIPAYRKLKTSFDYALMDEAHNLRTALDLDDKMLRSFHFKEGDGFYEVLVPRAITKKYSTRELNIETTTDILKKISDTEHCAVSKQLLKTLTQWRVFCVSYGNTCTLHFLQADPKKRDVLPNGRLLLFSATRLDEEELSFYCNIKKSLVKTFGENQTVFTPKSNVTYNFLVCTDTEKIATCIELVKNINQAMPTLILMNNKFNSEIWTSEFSKVFNNRVVKIDSGLCYSDRNKAYKNFVETDDRILITSSNVFWEGITIKKLRLLLIPYIPFPQPTMLELAEVKRTEYAKIAERRLIQGIGRIGRVPALRGVCILLFQPSKSFEYFTKVSAIELFEHTKKALGYN